jgi:hypothetical protein
MRPSVKRYAVFVGSERSGSDEDASLAGSH